MSLSISIDEIEVHVPFVDFSPPRDPHPRLGYDPIKIDPGSILDRIIKDRAGLRKIDLKSILN
jgi:hypothetical protein